ncbi:MAG: hypothetical protein ACRD0M_10475, partial [Acidimicrobiales bacterium]
MVHRGAVPFARLDGRLLEALGDVGVVDGSTAWGVVRAAWAAARADAVVCWCASVHAVAPAVLCRLRRRPFALVPAGYEVVSVPGTGYGWQGSWWRRRLVRRLLRGGRPVLAVSPYAAACIRAAAPGVAPVLVPNAVEAPAVVPAAWALRPYDVAMAVASPAPAAQAKRGLDRVVALAGRLPAR